MNAKLDLFSVLIIISKFYKGTVMFMVCFFKNGVVFFSLIFLSSYYPQSFYFHMLDTNYNIFWHI